MNCYNQSAKKKFSKELLEFISLDDKPYYITYIYNSFFDKISNMKSYNSYKLDVNIKKLLKLDYGNYVRASQIKKAIRDNHTVNTELPNNIFSMNINDTANTVDSITI